MHTMYNCCRYYRVLTPTIQHKKTQDEIPKIYVGYRIKLQKQVYIENDEKQGKTSPNKTGRVVKLIIQCILCVWVCVCVCSSTSNLSHRLLL